MKSWTWSETSIRPYESIWILTQRFVWLNAISFKTLAMEIGVRDWWRVDLIISDCEDNNNPMRHARNCLFRLLRLTRAQTRHAMVKFSLIVEKRYLRFCPLCLRVGYHSAVFQLQAVSHCPIHGCKLAHTCAQCGAVLPFVIDRYPTFSPFACPECGNLLCEPRVLISPPRIGDLSSIKEIWRIVTETPRVEWTSLTPDEGSALAQLISRMLAERLKQGRIMSLNLHVVRQPNACWRTSRISEACYLLAAREQRSVAIYKSYRRYLQRKTLGAREFAKDLITRLDASVAELSWSPLPSEASVDAYAFGLFRYAVEYRGFEGIRSVHARRATWVNPVTQRQCLPDTDILPKIAWLKGFHCSERDRQWIEDHALAVALQAIFADCLEQGRRMKADGRVEFQNIHSNTNESDAAAVAFFNPAGELEFWSNQFQKGEDLDSEQDVDDVA
jgi:hypothetical protein